VLLQHADLFCELQNYSFHLSSTENKTKQNKKKSCHIPCDTLTNKTPVGLDTRIYTTVLEEAVSQ
jgi:hypothetical protein